MSNKRITHKQKVKMARAMLTEEERREGRSLFASKAWDKRIKINSAKQKPKKV